MSQCLKPPWQLGTERGRGYQGEGLRVRMLQDYPTATIRKPCYVTDPRAFRVTSPSGQNVKARLRFSPCCLATRSLWRRAASITSPCVFLNPPQSTNRFACGRSAAHDLRRPSRVGEAGAGPPEGIIWPSAAKCWIHQLELK